MSIYNGNGALLQSAYNISGNEIDYAYDASGDVVFSKEISPDDTDDSYISGRVLVYEDKFETIDSENWGFELGRVRNNELQYYTDSGNNVSITPQKELCITAKRENYVNAEWTSASLTSFGKKEFKYGRFEAKIKFPKVSGAFPAFWTLGKQLVLHYYADGTWMTHDSGNWAYCGENDIVEHFPGNSQQISCGAYYSQTDQQEVGSVSIGRVTRDIDITTYHVYAIEWTSTKMTYYIDNIEWSSFNITDAMAQSFREPHYMIVNLAVGAAGKTPSADVNEMKMYVDWVRVYAPLK